MGRSCIWQTSIEKSKDIALIREMEQQGTLFSLAKPPKPMSRWTSLIDFLLGCLPLEVLKLCLGKRSVYHG